MAGGTSELRERVTQLEESIGLLVEGEEITQSVNVGMGEIWPNCQLSVL